MPWGHFIHEPRAMTMKLWEPTRKCPNAVSIHLQNHIVCLRTLKCSEVLCDRTLNQILFQSIPIHVGPHAWQNKINQRSSAFGVPWSPGFCVRPTSKKRVLKKNPNDHETWSIRCHVGIHVHFTSIVHSLTYSVTYSLKRSVKRRSWTGSTFSTNESAWSVMVTGSHTRVWSGPQPLVCNEEEWPPNVQRPLLPVLDDGLSRAHLQIITIAATM